MPVTALEVTILRAEVEVGGACSEGLRAERDRGAWGKSTKSCWVKLSTDDCVLGRGDDGGWVSHVWLESVVNDVKSCGKMVAVEGKRTGRPKG